MDNMGAIIATINSHVFERFFHIAAFKRKRLFITFEMMIGTDDRSASFRHNANYRTDIFYVWIK